MAIDCTSDQEVAVQGCGGGIDAKERPKLAERERRKSMTQLFYELENHQLELVRSTHCRDATKVLHHFETKVFLCILCDSLEKSPAELQSRLQVLAKELQKPRISNLLKRTFDHLE
ncbi:hypothetical protein MKX01_006374 [Papaver californicum]|nr:hypothetical protein MKX01_006374 [Papaver californicum]